MATILIIDDDDDLRLLLRLTLGRASYTVLDAATGAEAAELWPSADLILLDLRLPDIDGLDLLRGIGNRTAPVIAVSAHSAGHRRAAAIEAGCADYLTKPFTATELLDAVRASLPATS
jgi:two-component system, OmpR family, KDP operon response regulator KdpE